MDFLKVQIVFPDFIEDNGKYYVNSREKIEYEDNISRKEILTFAYEALKGFLVDCWELNIDAFPYIYDSSWGNGKDRDAINAMMRSKFKQQRKFWIKYKKNFCKDYVVSNKYKHFDND